MLILVGVTINFAINGGIINKAKEAGKQTQIAADREALLSCVIASMGLDGKVNFTELDQEILKIGFTGTNGTYTSPSGNVFTVNEDGNIVSEGESSGGSSSADADLAFLRTYIGSTYAEMMDEDSSGLFFKNKDIATDFIEIEKVGSIDESVNQIEYPIFYKGRAYALIVNFENGNDINAATITNVIERNANNTNADMVYLRTFIGKNSSEFATMDETTGAITFTDSNITTSQSYTGTPIVVENAGIFIPIEYKGNEYTMFFLPLDSDEIICMGIIEGLYEPETPVATD